MMRLNVLTASIAVLLLGNCGAAPPGPEPIPLDRINCARCGMLVSSDANAAQSRAPGQPTRFYDDIGCLAGDADTRAEGTARYVRLASGGWAAADAAWFAKSGEARTPMDYGVLAFASEGEAQAADRDGQARRWPAVMSFGETR